MEKARKKSPVTPQQAAAQRYPPQFLHGMVSAIINKETGNILEYRHLMKHPKYKDVWMKSFGTKIRCLVTSTKTIFFQCKSKNPCQKMQRYHLQTHYMHLLV
jgi:hypothetical protein